MLFLRLAAHLTFDLAISGTSDASEALCLVGLCLKPRVCPIAVHCTSFNGRIRNLEWDSSQKELSLLAVLTFMFLIPF